MTLWTPTSKAPSVLPKPQLFCLFLSRENNENFSCAFIEISRSNAKLTDIREAHISPFIGRQIETNPSCGPIANSVAALRVPTHHFKENDLTRSSDCQSFCAATFLELVF